jgi:hypothetical protein
MDFRDWNKSGELILQSYNFLSKTGIELGGGNCGQVALAVFSFLEDNNLPIKIGLITNEDDENNLIRGEPDIYHAYVVYKNQRYDETGPITIRYLAKLAEDQYQNFHPFEFIFEPNEIQKVKKIIDTQTNWTNPSNWFYNKLKNQS